MIRGGLYSHGIRLTVWIHLWGELFQLQRVIPAIEYEEIARSVFSAEKDCIFFCDDWTNQDFGGSTVDVSVFIFRRSYSPSGLNTMELLPNIREISPTGPTGLIGGSTELHPK